MGNNWQGSTSQGFDRHTRKRILKRDPICKAPGCKQPSEEVDHITPAHLGGTNTEDNAQGLCKPHHLEKTTQERLTARAHKKAQALRPTEQHPGATNGSTQASQSHTRTRPIT